MDERAEPRRTTVHDVARTAGVSLATVDRVLNARPGVRPETAEKVEAAIKALDFRRDLSASLLARARDLRVVFLIPDGGNAFMESLTAAVARRVRATRNERLTLTAAPYHALDPGALVARLEALSGRQTDCVVVVAPDVVVSDLRVTGGGTLPQEDDAGVVVQADRFRVERVVVDHVYLGIDLRRAHDGVVRGCTVSGDPDGSYSKRGDGIRLWEAHRDVVEGNTLQGVRDLVLWYSDDVVVRET